MKSRDIFRRPLTATRRGHGTAATSIFRRNSKSTNSGETREERDCHSREEDEESLFVVSIQPGPWPPHPTALSATADSDDKDRRLDRSAPLPSGTTSGSDECQSSPPTPFSRITTPSYYKIELVHGNGDDHTSDKKSGNNNNSMVQLTSGDDASVQITPQHNQRLQLDRQPSSARRQTDIIRASPIVEHESVEVETGDIDDERWSISNSGRIKVVPVPPMPGGSCVTNSEKGAAPLADNAYKATPVLVEANGNRECLTLSSSAGTKKEDDLSVPPMLVKANSSHSSSSDDVTVKVQRSLDSPCISLESPPRMTRSFLSPSRLFRDSVSADGSSMKDEEAAASRSSGSNQSQKGSRNSFDLLALLLDVLSLNAGCCRQCRGDLDEVNDVTNAADNNITCG